MVTLEWWQEWKWFLLLITLFLWTVKVLFTIISRHWQEPTAWELDFDAAGVRRRNLCHWIAVTVQFPAILAGVGAFWGLITTVGLELCKDWLIMLLIGGLSLFAFSRLRNCQSVITDGVIRGIVLDAVEGWWLIALVSFMLAAVALLISMTGRTV